MNIKIFKQLLSISITYIVHNHIIHESSKFQQYDKRISAMQVLRINTGKIDYRGE